MPRKIPGKMICSKIDWCGASGVLLPNEVTIDLKACDKQEREMLIEDYECGTGYIADFLSDHFGFLIYGLSVEVVK